MLLALILRYKHWKAVNSGVNQHWLIHVGVLRHSRLHSLLLRGEGLRSNLKERSEVDDFLGRSNQVPLQADCDYSYQLVLQS